jgi:hypothetical protein
VRSVIGDVHFPHFPTLEFPYQGRSVSAPVVTKPEQVKLTTLTIYLSLLCAALNELYQKDVSSLCRRLLAERNV